MRTSPIIIAELVHRQLNLCAGGIVQTKKRVPHMGSCQNYGPFLGTLVVRCRITLRTQKGTIILTTAHIRTQEGFASGTASVHAAESVIVPVKVISLAAGEWSCAAGLLIKTGAIVPVSGWIRTPFASAHTGPAAASSLPPAAAPVFFSLQCSYGGCFKAVRSGHLFVTRLDGKQSLWDLAIADSVPSGSAVRSSPSRPAATGHEAKHFRDARCMAPRLLTNRAIIQASGWIGPPVTSTPAIPPSAASSLRPVAVRMCHAFLCTSQRPVLSILGLAIADSVSYSCAVRSSQFSPSATGYDAKLVRDARCTAGRLMTNRAIIQASGWIRPPVTSTGASIPAIPPSAASSLRPVAAPVCFSLQHRCGKSWWQGQLKGVVSRHLCVSRQEGKQSLVDSPITDSVPCRSPYRCAVSFTLLQKVREWSCAAELSSFRQEKVEDMTHSCCYDHYYCDGDYHMN